MKHLRTLLLALCAALVLSPASAALSEASSVDVATMQTPPKKAKDKDKYTVVIWLEGNDPDCIDDIIKF